MAKILLVEDQTNNMRLMEQIIEDIDEDIILVKAASGDEAISGTKKEKFDLVLMDIALPDMDGMEITRRIRENPVYREVPIIAVTAHVMLDDKAAFSEIFNDYVPKPVDEDEITRTIKKWLGGERNEP